MTNWPAIGSIILPNIGGFINGVYFSGQIHKRNSWLDNLKTPCWIAPKWVYGPVWTALYGSMGYASYLVWEDFGGFNETTLLPLSLYGGQLVLSWAWTPMFFGLKNFKLAYIEVSLLGVAASATTIAFVHYNRRAAAFMLPYLAWLAYINSIAYYIWRNNPKVQEIDDNKDK